MVLTLVEIPIFSCTSLLTFFVNNFIMTGEPMLTASEIAQHSSAPYLLKSIHYASLSAMFNLLQGRGREILSGPTRYRLQ